MEKEKRLVEHAFIASLESETEVTECVALPPLAENTADGGSRLIAAILSRK